MVRGRKADGGAHGPGDGARPASAPAEAGERPGRAGVRTGWLAWMRAQPLLAAALLAFCVVAIGGLVASLPRGALSVGRTTRSPGGASVSAPVPGPPAPPARVPASRAPAAPAEETPSAGPGPWVEKEPSSPSARGLALVYRYRALPPGGESRYEWIVQVGGARSMLDDVEVVSWRMEPAAKNGAEFTSRDRAADGFPLFGEGPGGWFGVSARVRYRDGAEESLARRVELPE